MAGIESFEGRVAFVTGTGRENGIGWATAKLLGEQGAFVAAGVRTENDIPLLSERLEASGIKGLAVELDFTNLDGFASIVAKSEARLEAIEEAAKKPVTDLVHVAGVTHDNLALKIEEATWDEINLVKNKGPFFLTQAALRDLKRAKPGNVVSVSSVAGIYGHQGQANYAAANAAMNGWTLSLAREYDGRGINFNAVAPGLVDTDMTRGKLNDEQWSDLVGMMPSGEAMQPLDVATKIVEVLRSGETGQLVIHDGGMSEAFLADH